MRQRRLGRWQVATYTYDTTPTATCSPRPTATATPPATPTTPSTKMTSVNNADGDTTSYTYDGDGDVLTVTDGLGPHHVIYI